MIAWFSEEASKPSWGDVLLFLDRDGVINKERSDFIRRWEDVFIYQDTFHGLLRAYSMGLKLVIVSNQSGIARGYITVENFWNIHKRIVEVFAQKGIYFSAAIYCPHKPEDNCRCRKPSPEMLYFASEVLGGSLERSFLIGDRSSDLEAARRAGAQGILLCREGGECGYHPGEESSVTVCGNLVEAVICIENSLKRRSIY